MEKIEKLKNTISLENLKENYKKDAIEKGTFIDPKTFSKYAPEGVKKDLVKVSEMKKRFKMKKEILKKDGVEIGSYEEHEKIEYLLPLIINNGFLGEGILAYKTTEYDDYFNSADGYIEMKLLGNILAYAMDITVTTNDNEKTLEKKFKKIYADIVEKKSLTKIEYFKSSNFKGVMENIPKLIINFKQKDVQKIERMYLSGKYETKEAYELLFLIYEEIKVQLGKFSFFSETLSDLAEEQKNNMSDNKDIEDDSSESEKFSEMEGKYENLLEEILLLQEWSEDRFSKRYDDEELEKIKKFAKNHARIRQMEDILDDIFG